MNRTHLIQLIAVLVILASIAAIALHLREDPPPDMPRLTEAELREQAEHDGAQFLMHFDAGDWRGYATPARVVWSTIRFEVQVTSFDGAALASTSEMEPTPGELIEAYLSLGVTEAEPVLKVFAETHQDPAKIAAWRGSFLALGARIAEARRAYLDANLPVVSAAMVR